MEILSTVFCAIISILMIILIIQIQDLIKILQDKKDTKDNEEFNLDAYMNSLDFNTAIDFKIQNLLGKFNNEEIAEKVTCDIIRTDSNIPIKDKPKVKEYIKSVILLYNNTYTEKPKEIVVHRTLDEEIMNNQTNISDQLNMFYK